MKKTSIILSFLVLGLSIPALAGNDEKTPGTEASLSSTVSGIITDEITGEALPGVAISIAETGAKVYTDLDGKYEILNLSPGNYRMSISYISYKEINNQSLVIVKGKASLDEIKMEPLIK
jgi:hypothetical protein